MITIISSLIFILCLGIFIYDFFFQRKSDAVNICKETEMLHITSVKPYSVKRKIDSKYTIAKYPIVEENQYHKVLSKRKEIFRILCLSSIFVITYIFCIYLFGSTKNINQVLNDFQKLETHDGLDASNVQYFKILRFFSAGTMDFAFSFVSFYIWYMVHKRAFKNWQWVSITFLRQLDWGLFFAGLYVFFLAITDFLQIIKPEHLGNKFVHDPSLDAFSVLNSIFLLISCIYFSHNYIFFRNTRKKGVKLLTSAIAISGIGAFFIFTIRFTKERGFIGYFSSFDALLSVIALAVFSIGVAISFYAKGYKRFLPAFSLFAGLCFILTQVAHIDVFHDVIYGSKELKVTGNPVFIFCNRVVGFTSEIFIGVLFLLIGKTWSTAYESDIDRAAIAVYKELLRMMEENKTISRILDRIEFSKEVVQGDAEKRDLQLLEAEIARQHSQYMSSKDYARLLLVVENNKVVRRELKIKQPDQISIPSDIRTFIISEYEIERKVLKAQSNMLN